MTPASYIKQGKTLIDTLDQLLAINHPDALAKAHKLMNVALPGLIEHMRQHSRGPYAGEAVGMFSLTLQNAVRVLATKHGMTLTEAPLAGPVSADPKDWRL